MSYLANHLDRQERAVIAKLGAGHSINDAYNMDRWVRELAADVPVISKEAASISSIDFMTTGASHGLSTSNESSSNATKLAGSRRTASVISSGRCIRGTTSSTNGMARAS